MTTSGPMLQIVELDPGHPDSDGHAAAVAASVAVVNAARAVDSPWQQPMTPLELDGELRHGGDGEPPVGFLGTVDGQPVAFGSIEASDRDNLTLAWLGVEVAPDRRGRGHGSQLLEHLTGLCLQRGRTSLGANAWDGTPGAAFAVRHGFEQRSVAINRRQQLDQVDWDDVSRLRDESVAAAAAYDVVRRSGATPVDQLDAVAVMAAAINDAPHDDLEIEDGVSTPERVVAYEQAQAARGGRLHRVLVRHRDSGELAGQCVVVVDGERPEHGEQHDTSVVGTHRGHRLGMLLKTEMTLWLREIEPQLRQVDTWNAESNGHMIGINEQLGYHVLGRELQFQRAL